MIVLGPLGQALRDSFSMFWDVLWPLGLGFLLSAVVETFISKKAVSQALGNDSAKSLILATGFGAASSSCSYAAAAVGRSLFRKGASLRNAIIFEFAATNLVFELGLLLLILLGWQFLAGELAGGLIMVVILALLFHFTLRPKLVQAARAQAEKGLLGKMEGHGAMDMSVRGGSFFRRLFSGRAYTAISHYFFMNVYGLWIDLAIGFLIAGALSAWVPTSLWSHVFLSGHGAGTEVWGAVLGPLIAMVTFICSVGNIPLAAVLWRGGISFSGAIAFIFADLLILPILDIYRRYYTLRVAFYLGVISYVSMVAAGLIVGSVFNLVGIVPTDRSITLFTSGPSWNYTTWLDIAFLALTAFLGIRFLRTGGIAMLGAMEEPPSDDSIRDPVCGMTVDPSSAPSATFVGETYYFCSSGCRDAFLAGPHDYLDAPSELSPEDLASTSRGASN